MIEVTEIRKSYDRITAVDGISFKINKGETFGLLGPNGAGKTTIINMLVGILKPDAGTVNINGFDDPTKSEVRRQLGNAPQSLAIYAELSAEENLTYFAKLYNLSGAKLKERVDWALEFGGLTERRKSRVKTFSGGMKRRLNMACALVHEPPVILFDEPTVGVDPQSRLMIYGSIEKLKAEGRTIIYTTHYMEEAQRLCDRVAIIDHGKILALDTVDGLIEQYGGQSVIKATFEKTPPDTTDLPGTVDGDRLRIDTDQPMEQLAQLIQSGHKFSKVQIDRADLEAVFLNLTGRRLRD